jgi:hypothetical protein
MTPAPVVTVGDINARIAQVPATKRVGDEQLPRMLDAFVEQNEDPSASPNLQSAHTDDLGPIVSVLQDPQAEENEPLLLLLLKALKILSRKYENRLDFGQAGCEGTVKVLKRVPNPQVCSP